MYINGNKGSFLNHSQMLLQLNYNEDRHIHVHEYIHIMTTCTHRYIYTYMYTISQAVQHVYSGTTLFQELQPKDAGID